MIHTYNPLIISDRPAMQDRTYEAVKALADLPGRPHFRLSFGYRGRLSRPSALEKVEVGLEIGDIHTLEQAVGAYGPEALAKARLMIEIDTLINGHVEWFQLWHDHPFGKDADTICLQILPNIVRIHRPDPELYVYACTQMLEEGDSCAQNRLKTLSSFFIQEGATGHEKLTARGNLYHNQSFWYADVNAIEQREGFNGSKLKFGFYKDA